LAPPLMDQYVAALPGQPNPQDSYAEILRMAGIVASPGIPLP